MMLFSLLPIGKGVYEFHLACPKASIIASRALILASLFWAFDRSGLDIDVILSICTNGLVANTAKKVGAVEIVNVNGNTYFITTSKQFRRIL